VPKKHDPKKGKKWTHECPRKKRNNIAMSSCHSNKGERVSCKESFILIIHHPFCIHVHNLDQLLICHLHGSIIWFCNMWHMCILPFYLPWAPHKLSLEVARKEAMPWWGYIHIECHQRSYGEVKLWLVFEKYFRNPQSYGRKVEETEVSTVPLFNFRNILW
jgi:hypothetical protein